MTTLTTVVGMLPLALAWGEGAEMLQPLAVTIVAGLSYSTLVSLVLVPLVYRLLAWERRPTPQADALPATPELEKVQPRLVARDGGHAGDSRDGGGRAASGTAAEGAGAAPGLEQWPKAQ
jgi:hypothetical protein